MGEGRTSSDPRARRSLHIAALVAGVSVAFALAPPRPARAEEGAVADKRSAARAKLIDGDQLLKSGDFQQALTAFRQAYELFPSPKIHYNFALAYQGMGRNAEALEAFETFLNEATDAQPDVRDRARAAREGLLRRVGMLRVTADAAGAQVVIDGREVGRTPLSRAIPLDAGPHLLLVERGDGGPAFTKRFEISAGAALALHATSAGPAASLGAAAPPPSPAVPARTEAPGSETAAIEQADATPPAASGRRWRVAGLATASGGVLLLGAGALFGLAARSASQDVSRQYDADRDSAGKRSETLQWVGYGLGAAAIATGALLYLNGGRVDAQESKVAVRAFVTPRSVLVEGRF